MDNPFHYEKIKHTRTRTPPAFSTYKAYKTDLRIEFAGQCVYCRALDRVKGSESFGVDHYRPKKKFEHLATTYANLFYACNRCNSFKRDFWPSRQQARDHIFIPNPCDHVMFDHLRYVRGEVHVHSSAGAFTEERLDLNDPDVVEYRDGLITLFGATDTLLARTKKLLDVAQATLDAATTDRDRDEARIVRDQLAANVRQLEATLQVFLV